MVKKLERSPDAHESDVSAKPAPVANPLDALAAEAASIEGAAVAEENAAEAKKEKQEVDTLAADLADALSMAATVAQPALWWLTPEQFEALWGKPVQKAVAVSGAEIMRRHGLSMGDVLSKYGPYIGLAGALGPSTLATVAAFKRKKKELIEQQGGAGGSSTQAG